MRTATAGLDLDLAIPHANSAITRMRRGTTKARIMMILFFLERFLHGFLDMKRKVTRTEIRDRFIYDLRDTDDCRLRPGGAEIFCH